MFVCLCVCIVVLCLNTEDARRIDDSNKRGTGRKLQNPGKGNETRKKKHTKKTSEETRSHLFQCLSVSFFVFLSLSQRNLQYPKERVDQLDPTWVFCSLFSAIWVQSLSYLRNWRKRKGVKWRKKQEQSDRIRGMGVLYEDAVVFSEAEKAGEPTVITVNCPDKTGLGCDLCRVILLFGLSISRAGKGYYKLFVMDLLFYYLVLSLWGCGNCSKINDRSLWFYWFFWYFPGKFCSWDLIFLANKKWVYCDSSSFSL